jgi:hypothetical protein
MDAAANGERLVREVAVLPDPAAPRALPHTEYIHTLVVAPLHLSMAKYTGRSSARNLGTSTYQRLATALASLMAVCGYATQRCVFKSWPRPAASHSVYGRLTATATMTRCSGDSPWSFILMDGPVVVWRGRGAGAGARGMDPVCVPQPHAGVWRRVARRDADAAAGRRAPCLLHLSLTVRGGQARRQGPSPSHKVDGGPCLCSLQGAGCTQEYLGVAWLPLASAHDTAGSAAFVHARACPPLRRSTTDRVRVAGGCRTACMSYPSQQSCGATTSPTTAA